MFSRLTGFELDHGWIDVTAGRRDLRDPAAALAAMAAATAAPAKLRPAARSRRRAPDSPRSQIADLRFNYLAASRGWGSREALTEYV
jgi:hypothetical protein